MTPLERARELLEGMDRRRDERLQVGDIGDWQTEINEVRRILHYLIEAWTPDDTDGP